jgi:hypothetical protein
MARVRRPAINRKDGPLSCKHRAGREALVPNYEEPVEESHDE